MTAQTAKTYPAKKAAKKSQQGKAKRPRGPRTVTSQTPLYLHTLLAVAPAWYGDAEADEHVDALVNHLVTLGGNE